MGGQGLPDFLRTSCFAVPQVTVKRPGTFTLTDRILGLALLDHELVVSSEHKIAHLRWTGTWTEDVIAAGTSETFQGPVSLSGNRLVASVTHQDGSKYVNVYQRPNAFSPWQFAFRVHPSFGSPSSFGTKLELSGNSLVVTDSFHVHFIDLVKDTPSNVDAGASRSCAVEVEAQDVAISGSSAVVASRYERPMLFERGTAWSFHGGLPSGLFPRNLNDNGVSTLTSLWGAAIDGDRVAIGWRNHVRTDPNKDTGAALGFGFEDYDCGTLRALPGGSQVRVKELTPVGVTAPAFYQFPVENAVDGSSATRWMAPQTPGTTITFDLGELRMLHHLEIEWGTTYANSFTVQVTENGTTWFDIATVTGSGGNQTVDLSQNAQAFGSAVRLRLDSLQVTPGTGDWGVAIKEARIYRRVHDECGPSAPVPVCTGSGPSHVCNTACGGLYAPGSCYCDEACATYGDCCSFDGAHRGAEYGGGVRSVCGYD